MQGFGSQGYHPSGGQGGNGAGNEVFGGVNNVVFEIGRQNFEGFMRKGEQSFLTTYVPFVRDLRRYFQVDHDYVWRKLAIIAAPFAVHKFSRGSQFGSNSSASIAAGLGGRSNSSHPVGVGSGFSFGDDAPVGALNATINSSGSNTRGLGSPAPVVTAGSPATPTLASSYASPPPIDDVLAHDLYIPSMAMLTYVALCGFIRGLAVDTLTPEYLSSVFTSLMIWLFLEVAAAKIGSWSLQLPLVSLDALALAGYKHAGVCALLLIREILGAILGPSANVIHWVLVAYFCGCSGFFGFKSISTMLSKRSEDGILASPPARAKPLIYGWSAAQAVLVMWFALSPI